MPMRAFNVNKSNIHQIYDKITKLCQNTIRFIIIENFDRDIPEDH